VASSPGDESTDDPQTGPADAATGGPAPFRDVGAYHRRSDDYDTGWRGRMHHAISDRVAALCAADGTTATRVLDVGCGTGYLLRRLAALLPAAERLVGVDAASGMVATATALTGDARISFEHLTAERMPWIGAFDLVVSSTSFDHWSDQGAGLARCAAGLRPGGRLVLCDQFSALLGPTLIGSRRGKARTPRRANVLLAEAGFVDVAWHPTYTALIATVTATIPG
jgi:SAM-dependent methyltransferase